MAAATLRFGLVGFGPWGARHAAAIVAAPGACLAAIADASESRRAAARHAHPHAAVLNDWNELIVSGDLDVIDVVLPCPMHFDVAKDAIEAGRHVLVAAPLVPAFRQADELIGRACERKVMLAVGHHRRLSPVWSRLKTLVDHGLIGEPQQVFWEIAQAPSRPAECQELVHEFDLARWYLSDRGEPETLCVRTSTSDAEPCARLSAVVDFAGSDCPACCLPPADGQHGATCTVEGTQGTIRAVWRAGEPTVVDLRHGTPDHMEQVPIVEPIGESVELSRLIAALVQSIREGSPPTASGVDGRMAVRMAQAAEQSLRRGSSVRIRQVE